MKKRLFSLFLVCSMLASVFGMPVLALTDGHPTEGCVPTIENIQMKHTGNGQYNVTFDVNADGGAGYAAFQVFTQQFLDEDTPLEDLAGVADGAFSLAGGSYGEDVIGVSISDLIQINPVSVADNGTYNVNKFSFSLDPSVYQENGTTYYLVLKSNIEDVPGYVTYNIGTDGNVTQPPIDGPTSVSVATSTDTSKGGVTVTVTQADVSKVQHYVADVYAVDDPTTKLFTSDTFAPDASGTTTYTMPIIPTDRSGYYNGRNVKVKVRAIAKAGQGGDADPVESGNDANPAKRKFKAPFTINPELGDAVSVVGTDSITLRTTTPTIPATRGTHYNLQYSIDGGTNWTDLATGNKITGLTPGNTYNFKFKFQPTTGNGDKYCDPSDITDVGPITTDKYELTVDTATKTVTGTYGDAIAAQTFNFTNTSNKVLTTVGVRNAAGSANTGFTTTLSANSNIAARTGAFTFTVTKNNDYTPTAGTHTLKYVIYGQVGGKDVCTKEVTVTVTVSQKAVSITGPTLTKTYGQTKNATLADCTITGATAAQLSGITFTCAGSAANANASTTAYPITINVNAVSNPNYTITTTPGSLTVNKATLSASVNASSIKSGQAVSASTLTGTFTNTSNTTLTLTQADGTLRWDNPSETLTATADKAWTFTPNGGNYEVVRGSASVVVTAKTEPSITAADKSVVYNGQAQAINTPTSTATGAAVTVTYKNAAGDPVTNPTDVGVYTAVITSAETVDFAQKSIEKKLTITAKPVTLSATGLTITDKVYNKAKDAAFTGTPAINGIEAGDTVTVNTAKLTAQFDTVAAGDSKAVTVTVAADALTGADAGNYKLTTTSFNTTGKITKKPITIVVNDIEKVYGTVHTFNGTGWTIKADQPAGSGLAGDDNRDSLGITLSSDGAEKGAVVKAYEVVLNSTNTNYAITTDPTSLAGKFTVKKAKPIAVGAITSDGARKGTTVPNTALHGSFKHPSETVTVPGTLTWNPSVTIDADETAATVTGNWLFTPADAANYETVDGTTTIAVSDKYPAELAAESKEVSYTGEGQGIETPTVATGAGTPVVTYQDEDGNAVAGLPVNAGVYTANVTVEETTTHQAATATVTLTIKPIEPTGAPVAGEIERGQKLSDSTLTSKFKDKDGNLFAEGTYTLEWTPVIGMAANVIEPDGETEYTYTFKSNDGNYVKTAKILVPVTSAEREIKVTKVINLPNDSIDYLYLNVTTLKANDVVTFYSDAACENAISEPVTILTEDKEAADPDKRVNLNANALAATAGKIYAKLATADAGVAVDYPAEPGVNAAGVTVRVGKTATVSAAGTEIQNAEWAIAEEDQAIATVEKATDTTATVTGVAVGTVNMTLTATIAHPDEKVGGTLELVQTVPVTVKKKSSGGGGAAGGGAATPSSYTVRYMVGDYGKLTSGNASETVKKDESPKAVPEVEANEGYTFKGWSLDGKTVVNPADQKITAATTFTALYEKENEPVDTQSHKAYVYGYAEDGTFRPERGITRAEAAAIFARALTNFTEGTKSANTMKDIAGDEWYADYVNYLVSKNVITGYEDGTFRPTQSITRREFTAMISRLVEVLPEEELDFSDVNADDWSRQYISTALQNGWISGYEDGTFRPGNSITRAEVVRVVNAYLQRGVDGAGLANADYTRFPDVAASHWAYYEIIEAANDHTYTIGTKPEVWVK